MLRSMRPPSTSRSCPSRRRCRGSARCRCGRPWRRAVEQANHAFDDIVDIGEVSDHAALVVDRDRLVREDLFPVVGVEAVDVDAEVDLAERLLHRLAHLAHDDLAELLLALLVQLADAADDGGAVGDGRRAVPVLVCAMSAGDGVAKVVQECRGHGVAGLLPTLVTNSSAALAHVRRIGTPTSRTTTGSPRCRATRAATS